MFDSLLTKYNITPKGKLTCKTLISAAIVALAVILPQIVHPAFGQTGGAKLLPMYLPVLLGGCLLGAKWGVIIGAASPLVSFALTAMPTAQRLPLMMIELIVFALISGLFSEKIVRNGLWAFASVISAQIVGRLAFLGAAFLGEDLLAITSAQIIAQIKAGMTGLAAQAIIVPVIILILRKFMVKSDD